MGAARLGAAVTAILGAGLVWASFVGGGRSVLASLLREPIFLVTVLDVYVGCAIVLAWVWLRTRSLPAVVGWGLAFLALGNIGTGIYLIVAARQSRGDVQALMLGRSANRDTIGEAR